MGARARARSAGGLATLAHPQRFVEQAFVALALLLLECGHLFLERNGRLPRLITDDRQ